MSKTVMVEENMVVGGGSARQLSIDLVLELCTRVPVRKVFQFMCVSKVWCSIIRSPMFTKAYRRHNLSGLFISVLDRPHARQRFYYCTLGVDEPEEFGNPLNISLADFDGVTQIVNGLVSIYSGNEVYICNILTRDVIRLPDALEPEICEINEQAYATNTNYFLGFDPVDEVYKLVKVSKIHRCSITRTPALVHYKSTTNFFECQILTVGDSTWRRLPFGEAVLLYQNESCSINGVLFWSCSSCPRDVVISFDLREEKFGIIQPPRDKESWSVQCRGQLAFCFLYSRRLVLVSMGDDDGKSWSRQETNLPRELRNVAPAGNLPTGEILLVGIDPGETIPVYSYDYENNKFESFVVGKLPKSVSSLREDQFPFAITCAEQNFGKLSSLIHSDTIDEAPN